MNRPLISVIIPIYMAENTLKRCIDSVLAQTFTNFEVLLIDDGSPDRSGEMCDEYAQKDSRIRVFHKQNGGVASARQLGMDEAKGEYVIHADPDDYVEPEMLHELYSCAVNNHADIVICDYYINYPDHQQLVRQQPSSLDHVSVLNELFQQLHGSCCNKLVKRSCYMKYGITFPKNVSYCEDVSFWVMLLKNPVNIAYVPMAFYHYVQNNSSIVHSYMNKKDDDGWKFIKLLKRELASFPDIKRKACARTAFSVINDAYQYGHFNSFSFTKRYIRYVPYLLEYDRISITVKLFYARVCIGLYSYYKYRERQSAQRINGRFRP